MRWSMIREFKIERAAPSPALSIVQREIEGRHTTTWSILAESDSSAMFLASGIEDHEHAVAMCIGLALTGRFSFAWSETHAQR